MGGGSMGWLCFVALFAWLSLATAADKKIYIVNMKRGLKPTSFKTHADWYVSHLQSLTSSEDSLLYTYDAAYHGFAAVLDADQADSIRRSDAVVDVYEDTLYRPQTTHTPELLGLDDNVFKSWGAKRGGAWEDLYRASQDVIIGVLDTGVWPESKSFDDTGMGPIPAGWRGGCEKAPDFDPQACNKKLIGARVYSKGIDSISSASQNSTPSPRDYEGHGTHTSSTAAGAAVAGVSFLGYANGTARGMAPGARISMYKVCVDDGCYGADILAGIERAIFDGVHVLSISLAGEIREYYRDPVALGTFAAAAKGILASCAAGNNGPFVGSLANMAPWFITVASGTVDRRFPAYVRLGNGNQFTGLSYSTGAGLGNKPVPIIYAVGRNSSSNYCQPGTLDPKSARGKVVLCDRGDEYARAEKGLVVRDAGGVGMILANTAEDAEDIKVDAHLLPAVAVGQRDGDKIRAYVKSDPSASALLFFGETVLGVKPAPNVSVFSSRGPNTLTPNLLKPDVMGPGSLILAAWSEAVAPTELAEDKRKVQYNILSGTSMSCPHISGVAALLKAAHPDWSPSAIKSALITSASAVDNTQSPFHDDGTGLVATPFEAGSGFVNPPKAFSPGLVYDANTDDYIAFLCSHNYTELQVATIVKRRVNCAQRKYADPGELNYPSFSVLFGVNGTAHYTRVVTNVGAARSDYRLVVKAPSSVTVEVKPETLNFNSVGEKKTYGVTFTVNRVVNQTIESPAFGSISWVNEQHYVRSPVAFTWL